MKSTYTYLIILFVAFRCNSQITKNSRKHSLELYPVSFTYNKGIFVGQAIKYRYYFSSSIYGEVSSDGVIVRSLDARNDWFSKKEKYPIFNQSKVIFGYQFANDKNEKENRIKHNFGSRIGYHYIQHGTQNGKYWQSDTTVSGGNIFISGFQTHSMILGIQYQVHKLKENDKTKIHSLTYRIFLDYVFGVSKLLKGNVLESNNSTDISINKKFEFQRSGFNLGYNFSYRLSSKLSIHAGIEILRSPFINYSPNYLFFVPRGGERINPWFSTLKIGVGFN